MNKQFEGKKLNWSSGVHLPLKGYSIASRSLMYALAKQGVQLSYRYVYGPGTIFPGEEDESKDDYWMRTFRTLAYDPNSPEVVFGLSDVFYKNRSKYKIGYTMFETDKIPKHWIAQCNQMDEIWVPSKFNNKTFHSSGVRVPIHVMPLGVNPVYFYPSKLSDRYSEKYTFLSVFQWSERKNPKTLIRAFLNAFSHKDDVILVLKTMGYTAGTNVHLEIDRMGFSNWNSKIMVDDRELSDHLMGGVYRSADCFVFPTSGEGWGMPILEAMACGLPTISTNWSSHTDFFNEDTGYPIRVKRLIPAPERVFKLYQGLQYAEPDYEHLVSLMYYVYENQGIAKERGQEVASNILSKWTWIHAAQKIRERLIELEV